MSGSVEVMGYEGIDPFEFNSLGETGAIRLKDREDGETIQKTKEAALPAIEGTSLKTVSSLDEKIVTIGEVPNRDQSIENFVTQLTPEEHQLYQEEMQKLDEMIEQKIVFLPEEVNFIIQLREIIARAFAQQGRLTERDRLQLDKLKIEYQSSMKEQGDLFKKMGNAGLIVAFAGFGVFLGQFAFGTQGAEVIKFISSNFTGAANELVRAPMNAKQKGEEGKGALAYQQLQMKQSEKQNEGSAKQELSAVLQKALEAETAAARAG